MPLDQPRASFTNITAEPYKIRTSKASVDEARYDTLNRDKLKEKQK